VTNVTTPSPRQRMISLVIAAGLVLAALTPAWAADPDDRKREVERQLEQIQAELHQSTQALNEATQSFEAAQAQLPAAEQALAAAQQALAAAQDRLALAQGELAAAKAADAAAAEKLAAAEQRVRDQEAKIAEVTSRIEGKRASMSQVAVQAYQQGAMGQLVNLVTVFEAENLQEFTSRMAYAQSVINAEGTILTDLKDDRAELANERVILEELREEAQRLREEAARRLEETKRLEAAARDAAAQAAEMEGQARAAKAAVDGLVGQRSSAVQAAEQAKADDAAQYAALEAERDRIDAEIAEIARKAREEAARKSSTSSSSSSSGGSSSGGSSSGSGGSSSRSSSTLGYPVANPYITSPYGMRVHPVTGVYKLHDGTDFRAYCGTPIRAAAAGTVEWARYRGGYGNQVLISHSSLMTSYSHLSRFAASSGERVSKGEVIGYSGSTGYSTACHLHFMVYVDGVRTDPMRYL
jgi:murein DD-endopeptidase MepM/ murein hydrolase activator NlpD